MEGVVHNKKELSGVSLCLSLEARESWDKKGKENWHQRKFAVWVAPGMQAVSRSELLSCRR